MRGASAFQKVLDEKRGENIRVFVIWEPVLPSDVAAPSTMTLRRIHDARVSQYWDKDQLVSESIGEVEGVIWDYVAVYPQGKLWERAPPEPVYSDVPVFKVIDKTREAIQKVSQGNRK